MIQWWNSQLCVSVLFIFDQTLQNNCSCSYYNYSESSKPTPCITYNLMSTNIRYLKILNPQVHEVYKDIINVTDVRFYFFQGYSIEKKTFILRYVQKFYIAITSTFQYNRDILRTHFLNIVLNNRDILNNRVKTLLLFANKKLLYLAIRKSFSKNYCSPSLLITQKV